MTEIKKLYKGQVFVGFAIVQDKYDPFKVITFESKEARDEHLRKQINDAQFLVFNFSN